jgi:hypothetical protein
VSLACGRAKTGMDELGGESYEEKRVLEFFILARIFHKKGQTSSKSLIE